LRTKNSIYNFLGQNTRIVLSVITGLVLTPILLKLVGEENYGVYRVLTDILGYFDLVELGLYSGILLVFNRAISENLGKSKSAAFYACRKIYLKINAFALVLFAFSFLCLQGLVKVKTISSTELFQAYSIMGLCILFIYFRVYQAYLEASQKNYLISAALIAQNIVSSILAIIFSYYGMGIRGLALSYLLGQGTTIFLYMTLLKAEFNKLEAPEQSDMELQKSRLKNIQWPTFLFQLSGRLGLYSDNIIISMLMSAKDVSAFYITQRIVAIMGLILTATSSSVWAGMGQIHTTGDREKFLQLGYFITNVVIVLGVILLVPVFYLGQSFVSLWVGEKLFLGNLFLIVAMLNAYILSLLTLWGWFYTITHKIKAIVPFQFLVTFSNVGLSFFLTTRYSYLGPILGTLITFVLFYIWGMIYFVSKELGFSKVKLAVSFLKGFLYIIALSYLAYRFFPFAWINSWPKLIGLTVPITACNALLAVFLLLNTQERDFFKLRVGKLLGIGK